MKKAVYGVVALILFCGFTNVARAAKLELGAKFPVEKLTQEKKQVDNTIVAFMPSLTYDCEYASMLTQSFYYYFDQQLAFEGLKKNPSTRIFLVVKDKQDEAKSTQNIIGGMKIIYDENGEVFSSFGLTPPSNKNSDSTVFLLDTNDNIALIDEHYRAQGEHLKPMENKLKELNGIQTKVSLLPKQKPLKVGDLAPDFRVNEKWMLSDLRGNVVLVSFYPAAFSGSIPNPVSEQLDTLSTKPKNGVKITIDSTGLMSCTAQIRTFDLFPEEPKRILISSSTDSLLDRWRELLGTRNIEYTNDADYSISSKYLSYNAKGYNNRVSVIVDRQGKIAFIDTDFEFKDEAVINAKLRELLKKK